MDCKCKIAEPRIKVSENGTVSYCGKCAKKYENKRTSLIYSFANEIKEEYTTTTTAKQPFKNFLEDNNLMQRDMIKKDSIVESVVNQFKERSDVGIKKYGVTLDREDIDVLGWLNHLQQELMDATLYIEKLKTKV